MKHSIIFNNATSDWNEALPLGNGVMGGMVFFQDGVLQTAYNHYEVYYSHYSRYSQQSAEDLAAGKRESNDTDLSYEQLVQNAKENYRDYTKEPFVAYRDTIFPSTLEPRKAKMYDGASLPPTGEVHLVMKAPWCAPEDFELRLDIQEATVKFSAQSVQQSSKQSSKQSSNQNREQTAERVEISQRILTEIDTAVTKVCYTKENPLQRLQLVYPQRRNHEGYTYTYTMLDSKNFLCEVSFYPDGEDRERFAPFRFATLTTLVGAEGEGVSDDTVMDITLTQSQCEFYILTTVLTQLQSENIRKEIVKNNENTIAVLPAVLSDHKEYWENFFEKSALNIPDKFLERLWHYNLYILGASSGKDGKRKEQASGLNGLWDIRQPTRWGSLWYWDVNIQASYWPVYTANHLELAEVFNDGFLSYGPMAEKRAKDFYGIEGYAIDYPHVFYNSTFPWCAQFLWWYYEYTLDIEFLEKKAYPMFMGQVRFIKDFATYDKDKGEYFFFPDVSPEQGPLTKNSTITVATVKYLLEFTLKANKIIAGRGEDREIIQELLDKMPEYPRDTIDCFGEIIKDSEHANPYSQLRHPSLLMPIYPIGEIGRYSEEETYRVAKNTLRYVSERSELGVFLFGWISGAASRLGLGSTAIRVLYQRGLDLILRANGMGAEETDRWINYCLVNNPVPAYYPFMMECVGEIVASVNEMLLQSYNDEILVFPALPDKAPEPVHEILESLELNRHVNQTFPKEYPPWETCSFEDFRAKYGFSVSAVRIEGITQWVAITSLAGRSAKVRCDIDFPQVYTAQGSLVSFSHKENRITFDTQPGETYVIAATFEDYRPQPVDVVEVPFTYRSHLGRHVFAGKDRNTDTIKRIESFLYDHYNGNVQYHPTLPYRFSFGLAKGQQQAPILRDVYEFEEATNYRFLAIDPTVDYTTRRGFGFATLEGLQAVDRKNSNVLLRDFIQSETPNRFSIELPKGSYEILLVCGDREAPATLKVQLNDGPSLTLQSRPGEYKAEVLPLIQRRDEIATLSLESADENPWKLNGILLKKIDSYL